jgi:hypothetical protein
MVKASRTCFAAIACAVLLVGTTAAQEYPAGLVYGPTAAFEIRAPHDWVLSNEAGQGQDLPCVLYLQGSTWAESPVVMYAKIAGTNYTDSQAFARWAITQFQKESPGFRYKRVEAGRTRDNHSFIVNEYRGGLYNNVERVAYVQLPNAVAYIVLSARDEATYRKHVKALSETAKSLAYRPAFIGYEPNADVAPNKGSQPTPKERAAEP